MKSNSTNINRDSRYLAIKEMIQEKEIESFEDIFHKRSFPKSVLARGLGISLRLINKAIQDPGKITMGHIAKYADYFKVSYDEMYNICKRDFLRQKDINDQNPWQRRGKGSRK